MNRTTETTSTAVPPRATQAEDIRARWAWVEPAVWTERMLTALEAGVKGGVWFSLIDKVYSARNLEEAQRALEMVRAWTAEAGLRLHPDKTRIVNVDEEGFDFLGYRLYKHRRWPRRKSV